MLCFRQSSCKKIKIKNVLNIVTRSSTKVFPFIPSRRTFTYEPLTKFMAPFTQQILVALTDIMIFKKNDQMLRNFRYKNILLSAVCRHTSCYKTEQESLIKTFFCISFKIRWIREKWQVLLWKTLASLVLLHVIQHLSVNRFVSSLLFPSGTNELMSRQGWFLSFILLYILSLFSPLFFCYLHPSSKHASLHNHDFLSHKKSKVNWKV